MDKLDKTAYIVLKEEYICHVYAVRSVWDFINHLLTTYGEKTDDMLKANLKAMHEAYDCVLEHPLNNSIFDKMN